MKAKDLMIGDYYCWEAEGKKYPFEVTKDTFKLKDEDIANFEPIPITDEFLEKNFKDLGGEHLCYYIGNDGEVGWKVNSMRDKNRPYCHIDSYYYLWNTTMDGIYNHILEIGLKYVHELQHALRLVGLSDIADNLKV